MSLHVPDPDVCSPYGCPPEDHGPVVVAMCSCKTCLARTSETYDVPGRCLNCGTCFIVRSRKGGETPLYAKCPNCQTSAHGWKVLS